MDGDECSAEVYSWWYFNHKQTDGYWIRCTLLLPHDEHEDEHTGLTWRSQESPAGAGSGLLPPAGPA